jgi:hypothetical protein
MRRFVAVALLVSACVPAGLRENWTCDFDASESRPLAYTDAMAADEAGVLPAAECQATCGPPVTVCAFTVLDAGPGAICPVCTF